MTAASVQVNGVPAPEAPPLPHLFTARQVAAALAIGESTLYRKVDRGETGAVVDGRLIRFTADQVSAYVAAHTVPKPQPSVPRVLDFLGAQPRRRGPAAREDGDPTPRPPASPLAICTGSGGNARATARLAGA